MPATTDEESRSAGQRAEPSVIGMTSIETVTLEVADPTTADRFYTVYSCMSLGTSKRAYPAPSTG